MIVSKINDIKVKKVKIHKKKDEREVAGEEMFSRACCRINEMGASLSGKSTTTYNVLKSCVHKGSDVHLFSPTIGIDENYEEIEAMLKRKKCNVFTYNQLVSDDGEDYLKSLKKALEMEEKNKGDESGEDEDEEEIVIKRDNPAQKSQSFFTMGFENSLSNPAGSAKNTEEDIDEEFYKPPKHSKKIYPSTVIVVDDFAEECRSRTMSNLLAVSRHSCRIIINTHYICQLLPASIRQLDYLLVFGNQNEKNLLDIYNKLGFALPFDKFIEAYKYATNEQYSFLYIDKHKCRLRKNFDEEIIFTDLKKKEEVSLK